MRKNKARPGDERTIHDEREDWVERGSALSRLASDGRRDLEPVARQWLTSEDRQLAREGLQLLLSYWCDSPRAQEYVCTAIKWLESSEDPDIRAAAASNLGMFLRVRQAFLDEIIPALLDALEEDDDAIVQEACYTALLWQVDREEALKFPRVGVYHFDRDTDVRWDLLEPLRERFGNR